MKPAMLMITVVLLSFNSFAAEIPRACNHAAELAVAKSVEVDYYDADGFMSMGCELAPNKAAVICEVAASKGDGAANDTYRVVLNKTCKKAFRVDLIGEE